MRLPRYPLATVRGFREGERDRVRERLAARLRDLRRARGELEIRRRLLDRLAGELRRAEAEVFPFGPPGRFDDGKREGLGQILERRENAEFFRRRMLEQRRAVEEQARNVEAAEGAVSGAQGELTEATRGVRVLDRHFERWRREAVRREEKLEERGRDELVASTWVNERSRVRRVR